MSSHEQIAYRILEIGIGEQKRVVVGPANKPLPDELQRDSGGPPFKDRTIHNGSVVSSRRNECGEITEEMVFEMEFPDTVVRGIPVRKVIFEPPKKDHDDLDRERCESSDQ